MRDSDYLASVGIRVEDSGTVDGCREAADDLFANSIPDRQRPYQPIKLHVALSAVQSDHL